MVRPQLDRFLEIGALAFSLQFGFGNDAHRAVRARPVDAEEFAPAVLDPDEAEHRIGRLGAEIGDQTRLQALAPGRFGEVVDRINSAIEMGQHHAMRGGVRGERRDVGPRATHIGLQIRGDQPRMGLDAIEHARQQRLFQAAVAEPSDRGDRDCDQQDHRAG